MYFPILKALLMLLIESQNRPFDTGINDKRINAKTQMANILF